MMAVITRHRLITLLSLRNLLANCPQVYPLSLFFILLTITQATQINGTANAPIKISHSSTVMPSFIVIAPI
jgi:hypothetical protein